MKLNLNNKYNILVSGQEKELSLKEILGDKKTILYFYPADNTPGCTLENKDFTCLKNEFNSKGYKLVGISKNSMESHKKFLLGHDLLNDLISDPELVLHKELGAYGEKNNYGKIIQGVIRSTFVIDNTGEVIKEYKNIKATGHAARLLKELD
ncbi:peroxiredoxin [Candidatus Gracilibacteria bacterium]|nr:peroxiredoxin [Candidatus Gracilibacteria bacterium]